MSERRSRAWWGSLVDEWRRSGLSAREFAARAGVRANTLQWWSSTLGRGTRAQHGRRRASAITAIEVALPETPASGAPGARIEVVIGHVVVRCDVGTDVAYVTALARALSE